MAKLIALTVAEFVNLLQGGVKHSLGGMVAVTKPTLTVKDRNNHARTWAVAFPSIVKDNVRKVMHGAIMVGPDYVKMLENELAREGKALTEYKPGKRPPWHEAVPDCPCLRRKITTGELYFWVAFVQKRVKKDADGNPVLNSEGRPVYIHLKPKVKYVADGKTIPAKDLIGFLDVEKPPTNQGVDDGREAIVRTYKLESVRNLVVDGKIYSIVTK